MTVVGCCQPEGLASVGISTHSAAAAAVPPAASVEPFFLKALPSGRTVFVRSLEAGRDEIEVRAPGGEAEVRIVLGAEGPVVTVRSARRLQLASEAISVEACTLDLRVDEVRLEGAGSLRARMAGDVNVNGAMVRLNCDEETPA